MLLYPIAVCMRLLSSEYRVCFVWFYPPGFFDYANLWTQSLVVCARLCSDLELFPGIHKCMSAVWYVILPLVSDLVRWHFMEYIVHKYIIHVHLSTVSLALVGQKLENGRKLKLEIFVSEPTLARAFTMYLVGARHIITEGPLYVYTSRWNFCILAVS